MADPQLLTKQVIGESLDAVGKTIDVRFNLQRGKIARVWGFMVGTTNMGGATGFNFQCFVRKTTSSDRATAVPDILWAWMMDQRIAGTSQYALLPSTTVFFPKPHRTPGLTVQMHSSGTSTADMILVIYYDVDDVMKGELVQTWEKSRTKKYDRRMLAP